MMSRVCILVVLTVFTGNEAFNLRSNHSKKQPLDPEESNEVYGKSTCECIGIDGVHGSVVGEVGGKKVTFPADYGARCDAWDKKHTPSCSGSDAPDWCSSKWCYVDPCTCKGTEELPKPSDYLQDAEYQGVGLFYSYTTCGAKDSYSEEDSKENRKQIIKNACSADLWGSEECMCTGIAPLDGTVTIKSGAKYEADYGANCQKWDRRNDPKCKSDSPPDYCTEKWCYVNPDECKGVNPKPKKSLLLPDATSDSGKPLYFSYATCGGTDKFSGGSHLQAQKYGKSTCECIGIDGVHGSTIGEVDGKKVHFPADYGARCAAWDKKHTPGCSGPDAPAWCSSKWCYVDPCTCKGTEELPKPSDYLKDAEYQDVGLFYSYSTCGAKDSYSEEDTKENREKVIQDACSADVDNTLWGSEDCLCTGIAPVEGHVIIKSGAKYEADYGANCQDWDQHNDPKCKSDSPPDYCAQKWCYVNPDDCKGVKPKPKKSYVLPNATSDSGKPLYFSYATCGGTDKYTGHVMQKSKAAQLSAGILSMAAMFFASS